MSDDEKDIFEEAMEHTGGDIFEETHTEISLNDPIDKSPSVARTSVTDISSGMRGSNTTSKEERMDPRSGQFIDIHVHYPEKMGSGIGAYFVYKIVTKTNKPLFLRQEMIVRRRFSDFLGLHERLQNKYLSVGCIIPPAPEKDAFGNTKMKLAKEDQTNNEFLERRRASLERYLQRIARHPRLVVDTDFRGFLEEEKELPRSLNTQTLSGAHVKKLFKNVGDVMGKMTMKMDECDRAEIAWFEDKQVEMDNLERHLIQIHMSFEHLINQRKELASHTKVFAHQCSQLSHVEEHNGLARALAQLSCTQDEISVIEEKQAEIEFYNLLELVKDYLGLIGAVKDVLNERIRLYRLWQESESNLNKKREQKVRLELANKSDKLPQVESEIKECENRVERTKEDFENISKAIKKEMESFDAVKIIDFKQGVVKVLESMITSQENIIQHWEKYAPETSAISS